MATNKGINRALFRGDISPRNEDHSRQILTSKGRGDKVILERKEFSFDMIWVNKDKVNYTKQKLKALIC